MNQPDVKEKVIDLLDNHKIGVLATVEQNQPRSRYMTFFNDNFILYTPTNKETPKAEDIEENPHVHVLLGYDGEGFGDAYVEVIGKAAIREDDYLKEKIWHDSMNRWLDGPNDPDYVVLEIKPDSIRLMNRKGDSPQELDF
ncbi:General stress protein 26 [Alteribacillus persepolensis]|uniref:General stress protein 26 n=1 Tax=Alteribacillus persepolensis TaxID=568899 RepID=A0A1G8FU34_9BACI|nr:pyridoxamine 5'-phosphate oxidase family protein [Alteribacillus persepolensis]SDH85597.1 General stress protein 26 [Alteribacillus persepolensis]